MFDVDIDELRDQLGIGNIQRTLKALNDKLQAWIAYLPFPNREKAPIQLLNRFISTQQRI